MGHIYDISPHNIARAKALGMTLGVHGAAMQAGAHMPLRKIADSGIVFGLGTDATIVSHYSPFVTLGWVVSGLDVGGNRVLDETLTREEALIAHTRSNAYLFFQENALGSLEIGKQADLVVLDRDYMTVPAADQAHQADADNGGRTSGLQRSKIDARTSPIKWPIRVLASGEHYFGGATQLKFVASSMLPSPL